MRKEALWFVMFPMFFVASCSWLGLDGNDGTGAGDNTADDNTVVVLPEQLSFSLPSLTDAVAFCLSENSSSSKALSGNTLFFLNAIKQYIKMPLIDQNNNEWQAESIKKVGASTVLLSVRLNSENRKVIINKLNSKTVDISGSVKKINPQIASTEISDIWDGINNVVFFRIQSTVFKINLESSIISQMNNPDYTPISLFIPVSNRLLTPNKLILEGLPPVTVDATLLFSGDNPALTNTGSTPILDLENSIMWRLDYSDMNKTIHKLRLYKSEINSNNELVETSISEYPISQWRLIPFSGQPVDWSTAVLYSWFQYERRYLTGDNASKQDYVITMNYDKTVGIPDVQLYPISTSIFADNSKFAFSGSSFIVYINNAGLYCVNYQTNEIRKLYNNTSVVEWSLNGDTVIIKAYIDNVNIRTMKIALDGTVIEASQTDISPKQLVYF